MTTTTDCLAVAIQAQLSEPFAPPVILWGGTGCGKSKGVEAICKSLALNLTLLRVPQMQEADFAGYPVPDMGTGTMRFLAPSFAQSASVLLLRLKFLVPLVIVSCCRLIITENVKQFFMLFNDFFIFIHHTINLIF